MVRIRDHCGRSGSGLIRVCSLTRARGAARCRWRTRRRDIVVNYQDVAVPRSRRGGSRSGPLRNRDPLAGQNRTVTDEQRKDRERRRRYVARECLVSLMNDAKWRAAVSALSSIPGYRPRFRVRCIRDVATELPRWDRSFPWHVPTFAEIEWLEVEAAGVKAGGAETSLPHADFGPAIRAALDAVHVPFSEIAGVIRVVGYARPRATQKG